MARTRAANPAADDASPAAVGKLLLETRRRGNVDRGGRLESALSSARRRPRSEERQAWERGLESD